MTYDGLKNKKILVTGASGFIGSHLCKRLAEFDVDLHGVSRTKQEGGDNNIRWWEGDLSDFEVSSKILTDIKPDFIFHLASHVVGARDLNNVIPTFYSNLATTVNLLNVSTAIGCKRIILIGSLEEPGEADIPAIPSSPYAAAKWACSGYARMFHALYETPVTCARLFMVYGPRQQDLRKLIPYVTLSLLRNKTPKLTGGHRQVDWIYVKDVVEGLLAVAQAANIEGQTVDIGSGSLVSVADVVKHLVDIVDSGVEPLFGSVADRPMEQIRVADIKNTYAKIGWKAKIDLEAGLQYTVEWYKEQNIDFQ